MKHTHIQEIVRTESDTIKTQTVETITGIANTLQSSSIIFTNGVSSPSVLFGNDDADIVVPITVLPDKHTHDKSTLDITPVSAANKIVTRDTSGNIFSSGTSIANTGYKLITNEDIATLFQDISRPNITSINIDSNSPSGQNVIIGLQLEHTGSQVKLYRTYGWVCNCNRNWYCNCCC